MRLEVKVLWVVALDGREGLVEEWPQLDAERALDAGQGDLLEQIGRARRHRGGGRDRSSQRVILKRL